MLDSASPNRAPSSFEIEREVRLARGFAISAAIRSAAARLAKSFRMLARRSARLVHYWAAERLRRNAIRALDQLDDRTLADIGVRRCGIEFAVRNGLPGRPIRERSPRQYGRGRGARQRRAA